MVNELAEMSNTIKPAGANTRDPNSHLRELIATNAAQVSKFLKRAIYKVRRTIYSIPLVKSVSDRVYETKVAQYKASLPKLNDEDQAILETLQKTGTFSIPIEDLQLESTEAFLKTMANLVAELKNMPIKDQVLMDLDPDKFKEHPEVFLWGIEQRMLNIIEHYIGLPLYYHGCSLRRDIVTNRSTPDSVRSWHLDGEDRTVVKIIVYLNDVGLDGGHYQYIPKDLTQETVKKLNYYLGYLDDQTIMNYVPKKDWQGCPGKLGTVIITNTSHIFHRAKPPEKEDRFSISFCYTSNKPPYNWGCASFPENLEQIQNQLNEKQRNVLINKNKLFGIKL